MIAALLALCCLQDWEKEAAEAFEKAKKNRQPVLILFGSSAYKTGTQAASAMKNADVIRAAKPYVLIKVDFQKGFPKGWPLSLNKMQYYWGGIALVSPTGETNELRYDHEITTMKPEAVATWISEAADRLGAPWDLSVFAAETRAKREGKPLVVMMGSEKEFCLSFRDPALVETLKHVVLLRVPGDSKRYTAPGSPGVVMIDPVDRTELASWSGSKKGADIKALLEKPVADWQKTAGERRRAFDTAHPYVCGSCGYRSTEAESCCGDVMLKPEPPVWEKTWIDAKQRAAAEGRVLIYVVMSDPKELTRAQEIFGEARLAVLVSRCIIVAEEASDAGRRPAELGVRTGIVVLSPGKDGGEPVVESRLNGVPKSEDVAREIGMVARRLKLVKKP